MFPVAQKYFEATWWSESRETAPVKSIFTLNDRRLKTKVLQFPCKVSYLIGDGIVIPVSQFLFLEMEGNISFIDVPFCQLPEKPPTFAELCHNIGVGWRQKTDEKQELSKL
jgi:hypothetical protein